MSTERDTNKQIEYYATALKAPRIRDSAARLADQARDAGWNHEEYLAAVLSREVSSRESSGAELRIRAAGFPGRKAIEEFNFDHQPTLGRDTIAHLSTSQFIGKAQNVVLLGPRAPARRICPSDWASPPPSTVTACCSRPPWTGSPACRPLASKAASPPS
jgi:DNA replication protein DnaC